MDCRRIITTGMLMLILLAGFTTARRPLRGAEDLWGLREGTEANGVAAITGVLPPAQVAREEAQNGAVQSPEADWGSTAAASESWWVTSDYLLYWTNGNDVPPLVSTNATAPVRDEAGLVGLEDTEVAVGGSLDDGGRSGVGLQAGYWLDNCHCWAVEGGWWCVGDPSNELDQRWSFGGEPVLARPFFNVGSGVEDAQLVAYPDFVDGAVEVATSSDLRSAEALLRMNWAGGSCARIDLLGGYRYFRFREGVLVQENFVSRNAGTGSEAGTTLNVLDRFDTANSFHGGTLGLRTSWERGWLELDAAAKLAIGGVERRLRIDGRTVVTAPGGSESVSSSGLLALSSNQGGYTDDAVALLPELDINTRILLTDHLTCNVGYNLLFLTDVYRAGDQIDRRIDPGLLSDNLPVEGNTSGGLNHPSVPREDSTLCVQGLNLGCTLTY